MFSYRWHLEAKFDAKMFHQSGFVKKAFDSLAVICSTMLVLVVGMQCTT